MLLLVPGCSVELWSSNIQHSSYVQESSASGKGVSRSFDENYKFQWDHSLFCGWSILLKENLVASCNDMLSGLLQAENHRPS